MCSEITNRPCTCHGSVAKINSSRKGTSIEAMAKDVLKEEGYRVHRTVRTPFMVPGKNVMASHNNDVFGVFDLVAANPKRPVRFVQVTVSEHVADRMAKVSTVVEDFPPAHTEVEVWGWVGGAKRRDNRFKDKKVFVRRQFFKRFRWQLVPDDFGYAWVDVTPQRDGWIDGYEGWKS